MDEQQKLTDSEIQKLRDDIKDRDRRDWLWKTIRTGLAWGAGTLAAALSLFSGIKDIWQWLKS